MAGLIKNRTVGGASTANENTSTSTTSTLSYGFPSGAFTQKQPTMPSDQKAKLLAMHRDGKANAGIYVAVVLFVYFILVILLLCRYGKRRRAPEPIISLEAAVAAEQGRFHLLNFHIGNMITCKGGCCKCFSRLCVCCCQSAEGKGGAVQNPEDYGKEVRNVLHSPKPVVQVEQTPQKRDIQLLNHKDDESLKISSRECKGLQSGTGTTSLETHEYQPNEDSDNEDSLEED